MPLVHKWVIVLIVCTGSACVTCASSIYTTTYEQMNAEFGTTTLISTVGLSSFVFGIGLGPLLTGPLSEHYGRRPIYLVSWALFIIWTIPSAVAQNIETLILARFFQGFVGGTFLSVAGGTVGDIFAKDEIQKPMALVSSAPFIGPSSGPVLGGFINYHAHWRWTYYILIIWSAVLLLAIVLFAPETRFPARVRDEAPKKSNRHPATRSLALSLLRPFQMLFLEPMCLCLDLYSAVLLGILYLFFGAFPLVFKTNHDMNLWQVGLTFLGIITGMLLAAASNPLWNSIRQRLMDKCEADRNSEPEYRLPPAILGAVFIPVGLFWFGWTTYSTVHWIAPVIGSAVFGCGVLLVFTGVFTFLVDAYPNYAASALAANGFVRCSFAAAFPLFGNQMYEKLGYQWATSVLAFITLAMMPFPLLFLRYGKVLRKRSKFAVET
ncbi:major facilitator superfamily domain-containing protein [Aspergillus cavernicola]|uniref:Major facilitator superfamily domain-containing protein n=1 Tax=Aspergillus cavernicola TaxID=176166 RepID=A0ABR4HSP3_9EURO